MRNLTCKVPCLVSFSNKVAAVKIYKIFTSDKGLEQCNSGNSGPVLSSHLMLGHHSRSSYKQNAQIVKGEVSHFAVSHCLDMVVHRIRWCRRFVQASSCCMCVCNVSWEFNSAITATEYNNYDHEEIMSSSIFTCTPSIWACILHPTFILLIPHSPTYKL
jgi:hypothetical protein